RTPRRNRPVGPPRNPCRGARRDRHGGQDRLRPRLSDERGEAVRRVPSYLRRTAGGGGCATGGVSHRMAAGGDVRAEAGQPDHVAGDDRSQPGDRLAPRKRSAATDDRGNACATDRTRRSRDRRGRGDDCRRGGRSPARMPRTFGRAAATRDQHRLSRRPYLQGRRAARGRAAGDDEEYRRCRRTGAWAARRRGTRGGGGADAGGQRICHGGGVVARQVRRVAAGLRPGRTARGPAGANRVAGCEADARAGGRHQTSLALVRGRCGGRRGRRLAGCDRAGPGGCRGRDPRRHRRPHGRQRGRGGGTGKDDRAGGAPCRQAGERIDHRRQHEPAHGIPDGARVRQRTDAAQRHVPGGPPVRRAGPVDPAGPAAPRTLRHRRAAAVARRAGLCQVRRARGGHVEDDP
ncbi:hypothetical protein LTR94_026194, partial [Friedmanniomyces endolithicus]